MTYLVKPKLHHPALPKNALGFTHRDYEGTVSTLCAGCGHDSISSAIIQAFFELDVAPHRVAKLSGIGCSSKTPTYFLGNSHGFNSVHGRMPSVLTGANLANRDLIYLGVSGDGDSASIGLGQFAHSMRRGVNMVYIVENNGVYGLTKGQFSATADKRFEEQARRRQQRRRRSTWCMLALQLGASFVARSFSGDKEQLVPLIKAAVRASAAPRSSTSSARVSRSTTTPARPRATTYVREHNEAVNSLDFMPLRQRNYVADYAPGSVQRRGASTMDRYYDCASCMRTTIPPIGMVAMDYLQRRHAEGEIVTGLLYLRRRRHRPARGAQHRRYPRSWSLAERDLVPGAAALEKFNASLR